MENGYSGLVAMYSCVTLNFVYEQVEEGEKEEEEEEEKEEREEEEKEEGK